MTAGHWEVLLANFKQNPVIVIERESIDLVLI